jgi:hypothetical protein
MTEFPAQQPTVDPSTEQWFDSIQEPPTPPQKSPKLLQIGIAGAIVLLAIIVGIVSAFFMANGPRCLNTADYKTLTGTDTNEVSTPPDEFYSSSIAFKDGSTDYVTTTDSAQNGKELIQKIADFYTTNTATTSILISLRSNYFTKDASSLATAQINTVKADFVKAGVPESALSASSPVYIEPEDVITHPTETIIGINSAVSCKQ